MEFVYSCGSYVVKLLLLILGPIQLTFFFYNQVLERYERVIYCYVLSSKSWGTLPVYHRNTTATEQSFLPCLSFPPLVFKKCICALAYTSIIIDRTRKNLRLSSMYILFFYDRVEERLNNSQVDSNLVLQGVEVYCYYYWNSKINVRDFQYVDFILRYA